MTSRAAVGALWRLDSALGNALAGGREPLISRIKLAWWREALEKLDGEDAPAEPVLQALAGHVLPRGVSGAELARMEAGWSALADPEPLTEADLELYANARGETLFGLTARLLGCGQIPPLAGEAWALVDLARHSADPADREAALAAARMRGGQGRWPGPLRPIGMLEALALRDCEPERPQWELQGSPGRMWRMLRHRLNGG